MSEAAPSPISLAHKLAQFSDVYNPRIVARYNGNEVRVAKLHGPFTWHAHEATDELFLVLKGRLTIEFEDGAAQLGQGDLLVVPAGTRHRPVAHEPCEVLLIDREGEPNTGATPSHLTRDVLEAI